MKRNILFLIVLIIILSCKKEAGEGGTGSIEGRVFKINYNETMNRVVDTTLAEEEDIYIMYGDDELYNNRSRTNFDGKYIFKYLQKGNYTIYAYSRNPKDPNKNIAVKVKVEIKNKGNKALAGDIYINKIAEDGTSSICGRVWVIDYNTAGQLKGEYWGQNEDVFIIEGDSGAFLERTRTSYDGSYCFSELRKGKYTVFVYSKSNNPAELIEVKKSAVITENNQHLEIEKITIIK